MSKSKVLPTHGAILRQIAINSTCFNMLKFHQQKHQTKKYILIQVGLYDSTSTSKLLLSFVRLTYLKKKTTAGCAAVGPLFFRKVGSNPWPSCISGTGRKLTSDMVKKGWPSSRRPFGWICRCPLNKQTAGGVLTLLTSASFFSCSIQQLWFLH